MLMFNQEDLKEEGTLKLSGKSVVLKLTPEVREQVKELKTLCNGAALPLPAP